MRRGATWSRDLRPYRPRGRRSRQALAGNNLACGNCHLQAGTKKFGIALFGLYGEFPRYSIRQGHEISLEDRFDS